MRADQQNANPSRLLGRSTVSSLQYRCWHSLALNAPVARVATILRSTIMGSPELFLPVACLFVWQLTAIAAKTSLLICAASLTALLLIYAFRVLGRTEWLRRVGWASPRQGFWAYSFIAGIAAAGGVWWFARIVHQSLGGVPPAHRVLLAGSSGPMIEELLFRGLIYWLIFGCLRRAGVAVRLAICVTVFLTALAFAFSHNDRQGPRLYATILTGIAFGWMRAQSDSTAAATVMHAVYNLALLLAAMLPVA
jgi:membrane protease YdiL (CAAX protease family)